MRVYKFFPAISISAILLFIYLYPRYLLQIFETKSHPLMSYFYHYGLGGLVFLIGVFVVFKANSIMVDKKKWAIFLFSGFFYFVLIHGLAIFSALYFPYKGQ